VPLTDVFLSYSRDDQATARRFAEAFEREGFSVWWDQTLRSGEAYDEVTEGALRNAKAVVVLWSKKSVVSRWVRAEATLADRNRTLVPAMIEPCERPIMFELTQTADLSKWGGEANDRTWQAFLADVRQFVGSGAAQPSAPGPATAPPAGRSLGRGERPSLAILPFMNRSGERADDVFADGMVDDLILALSMSGGIKVIAQSATAVYRNNVSDLRSIGRDLGVRYLLEGNVRRVGASLRVTAQLVEADNGAILWSRKFDRPLTELAELQEQLVMEVAGQLGAQMERAEMEKALRKPGDLSAWEAVMRSMAANETVWADDFGVAIAEARRAIAIDPEYALGQAMLGYSLATSYMLHGGWDKEAAREACTHAERALAIDSDNPMVLTHVACALGYCGRWSEALQHAQCAVELNPNMYLSRQALAQAYVRFNRPDEAIAELDAASIFAPRGYYAYFRLALRAIAHFQAGRLEAALQAVEQSLQLSSNHVYSWKDKTIFCEELGRHEEARESVRRMRAIDPSMTLPQVEAVNAVAFFPPELRARMNATFRKVWEETSVTA
jgi:TolB-like protein